MHVGSLSIIGSVSVTKVYVVKNFLILHKYQKKNKIYLQIYRQINQHVKFILTNKKNPFFRT